MFWINPPTKALSKSTSDNFSDCREAPRCSRFASSANATNGPDQSFARAGWKAYPLRCGGGRLPSAEHNSETVMCRSATVITTGPLAGWESAVFCVCCASPAAQRNRATATSDQNLFNATQSKAFNRKGREAFVNVAERVSILAGH